MGKDQKRPTYDPEIVRDISVAVYCDRLGADATSRMLGKDADGGKKLRDRAGSYDPLTRAYFDAIGSLPAVPTKAIR
jgi:hypothetical protein